MLRDLGTDRDRRELPMPVSANWKVIPKDCIGPPMSLEASEEA